MITRRTLVVSVCCLAAGFSGCATARQSPRAEHDDDDSPVEGVHSKPPKGFFKGTRLPGALSSEGSDIERNLGVQ